MRKNFIKKRLRAFWEVNTSFWNLAPVIFILSILLGIRKPVMFLYFPVACALYYFSMVESLLHGEVSSA